MADTLRESAMKHSKLVLALLLAISLSPSANAKVISIGTVGATNYLLGFVGPGLFTDNYLFTLSGTSNITDAFNPVFGISGFNYSLSEVSPTAAVFGPSTSYSGLSAGTYDFTFTGTNPKPTFPSLGIYFGDYNVASAGAVPELDTWLMLVIGAGLLVYQLRRRQNTLRHSQLAAT
jgi:hypothetical protein